MDGLIVLVLLWVVGLMVLYWVVRLAVRHALADHDERREHPRVPWN
jgi:hypothetical protein